MSSQTGRSVSAVTRMLVLLASTALGACRADEHARDADHQVYGILDRRQEELFGDGGGFSLEEEQDRLRVHLLEELKRLNAERLEELRNDLAEPPPAPAPAQETQDDEIQVGQGDLEERLQSIQERYAELFTPPTATAPPVLPPRVLRLRECLEIAAENSREYQQEKEAVYLVALDLTFERYQFEVQSGAVSSYTWVSTPDSQGPGRERTGTLDTSLSMSRLLGSGGFLVLDFTNTLFRRFTGINLTSSRRDVSSFLSLAFTQPLLRGAGRSIVEEPLIQAERDVIYALRSFERFRREFAVRVARSYYNLVRELDSIDNARRSYVGVIDSRELAEALRRVGRSSQIDLDRARTSELNARNSWVSAIQSYEDGLDEFKILLGLPIETNLALDPEELMRLSELGLEEVGFEEWDAIDLALALRLDHQNAVDQLADAGRRVKVAEDDLRAALDLSGAYSVGTDRETVFDFRGGDATYSLGAQLDLPIDRLAERNGYRRALIGLEAEERARSLSEDFLKQEVRSLLRRLAELRESYEIQHQAVEVAERRVQATSLQLRKGRVPVREVLEATDDLARARNQLTSALTNYRVGVMELYLAMGLLRVTEEGIEFASRDEVQAPPLQSRT